MGALAWLMNLGFAGGTAPVVSVSNVPVISRGGAFGVPMRLYAKPGFNKSRICSIKSLECRRRFKGFRSVVLFGDSSISGFIRKDMGEDYLNETVRRRVKKSINVDSISKKVMLFSDSSAGAGKSLPVNFLPFLLSKREEYVQHRNSLFKTMTLFDGLSRESSKMRSEDHLRDLVRKKSINIGHNFKTVGL